MINNMKVLLVIALLMGALGCSSILYLIVSAHNPTDYYKLIYPLTKGELITFHYCQIILLFSALIMCFVCLNNIMINIKKK